MEFEVKMVYNRKDFYAFGNALLWRKANTRSAMLLRKWGAYLFGGFLTLTGILGALEYLFLPEPAGGSASIVLYIAFMAIGVLLIYSKSPAALGRSAGKRYSAKGQELIYRFGEDRFSEHIPTSDIQMDYSVISRVLESQTHFFLFINQNAAHILRKDRFTQGDPAQFGAFLSAKTGLPVQKIH